MTCIVGLVEDGRVYLGGDSAGTAGADQNIYRTNKVFKRGPFIIGGTGSYRGIQLMQWDVPLDKLPITDYEDQPLEAYLHAIGEIIRDTFKEVGHSVVESNEEQADTTLLIGIRGRLFSFHCNYAFLETFNGYDSVGSGAPYAIGSLHATNDLDIHPATRVWMALEAAEEYGSGVKRPFSVMCLESDTMCHEYTDKDFEEL